MKKEKIKAAAIVAALALALTGCQNGQNNQAAPSQSQAPAQQTAGSAAMSAEQATARALEQAGAGETATAVYTEKEREDGRDVYEVSFYVGSTKYEVEIDAADGSVKKSEQKAERAGADTAAFSRAQAEALALGKVPGAAKADIGLQYETDDGKAQFDGRIVYGGRVYEFEIDAQSGDVLKWKEKAA